MNVYLFLAEGFEEIEAVATLDILKRGGINAISVSITRRLTVKGAHGISLVADRLFESSGFARGEMLVLPGGLPGAKHLNEHRPLRALLLQHHAEGKPLAAICAAPSILGGLNLLQGKRATVYPGFERTLHGAILVDAPVVVDHGIITAQGPGSVIPFALTIIDQLKGQKTADEVASALLLAN